MATKYYNYQYGSEAHAYYEAVPTPSQTPSQEPRKQPSKKLDKVLIVELSLCSLAIFCMSFAYIHTYATYNLKQRQLQSLKTETRDLKSTISLTQAKISEKLDLDYVRERATKELGMKLPEAYQIVYIELPKESHTVYAE